jgi:uncharacterized protein YgfB (UPF0149 family)
MTEKSLPSYRDLTNALSTTSLKLHPSQAHGLICGILCGKLDKEAAWEALVTGGKESSEAHEVLQELFNQSTQQLKEFLFELQLMLPPDSEELPERAEALTLWCQGFLTGLKLVQIPIVHREPSDITDAINDLIEIAKMNYEEVVASEEDEAAYAELVEYVRMAAILIYQEVKEQSVSQKQSDASNQLH